LLSLCQEMFATDDRLRLQYDMVTAVVVRGVEPPATHRGVAFCGVGYLEHCDVRFVGLYQPGDADAVAASATPHMAGRTDSAGAYALQVGWLETPR
jgi:hypothetical protein